jgi:hypothetical protein
MGMELQLVPVNTKITESGNGQICDVSGSGTRTFLCVMTIHEQIEQESIDLSVWGSEDGENFGQKPLLKLPQRFYRGETKLILDLTARPEVKFVRARWDLFRWGRVAPEPMFVISVKLTEIPAMPQRAPIHVVGAQS